MFKPCTIQTLSGSKKSDLSSFFSRILIVVVLFERKPEESEACTSIHDVAVACDVFPETFIYDNSLQASLVLAENITYYHDPLNPGVSAAYNTASTYAESKRKTWMLFLDQDTAVTLNFFEELRAAIDTHNETVAFVPRLSDQKGVVSPFRFAFGRGRRINTGSSTLSLRSHRFANSGLLIKLSAFQTVGGYDPEIPLDFSDISFGKRLMAITDHFWVLDTILSHDFSNNLKLDSEDALVRFHHYCVGASVMGRKSGFLNVYTIQSLLRACHLSMRYKSGRFISAFFQYLLHG